MIKLATLMLLTTIIFGADIEIIPTKERANDTIVLGITGQVGETIPLTIIERTFENGIKFTDKELKHPTILKKKMNELIIDRTYVKGTYIIKIDSDDLGFHYSYNLQSPFVGLPLMFPSEDNKELAILKIEGYYMLNEKYYPRVFLKLK